MRPPGNGNSMTCICREPQSMSASDFPWPQTQTYPLRPKRANWSKTSTPTHWPKVAVVIVGERLGPLPLYEEEVWWSFWHKMAAIALPRQGLHWQRLTRVTSTLHFKVLWHTWKATWMLLVIILTITIMCTLKQLPLQMNMFALLLSWMGNC